ncbi:MAG: hypothetical protein CME85_09045 [Henriciella sp.]|jgi:hypothetical protein|uniref:hypothetical protein n=1 Tax=Henriciella sp. TaxID=1968823 RepID=UPI000C0D4407|nr:hypothetical protein [Henriciella sp.]MAN74726.1 hypothetical protein [Henriciella sp.]MBF32871.1 hypothetical protein [Hyphomonadaceae bacterium]MBK75630.1 hypothetical protein [Henriciella sp.]PHR78370.1 MAG: hypothetical protein COA64_08025 [Henriciella sp.]|tara:strand:- start:3229 stop:3438 length:210 start_codon:yes stop_codon:yes gene_type:complete
MQAYHFRIETPHQEQAFEAVFQQALKAAGGLIKVTTSADLRGLTKTVETECVSAARALGALLANEVRHA